MTKKRRIQNLLSDELSELLVSEGALRPCKCERAIDRMIMHGEQLRLKKSRRYSDEDYRIDDL